jgi:hypothetical protein
VGGVGGDDDADDGEWLSAVRAAVVAAGGRDVIRDGGDGGRDGGDGGDDARDDVIACRVVAVTFAPGRLAAGDGAVAFS